MILVMGWRWQAGVAKKGAGYKGPSWDGGYVGSLLKPIKQVQVDFTCIKSGPGLPEPHKMRIGFYGC